MKSTKDFLLIGACMLFGIVLGAAVYEHLAVIPKWNAAIPSSLSMFQGKYGLQAQYFWVPIHPFTIIFMVAALIANWHNSRRKNILYALTGYVLILIVTYIYFVPTLIRLIETPYSETVDEALTNSGATWEILSLLRLVFIVIISYLLLSSLTKPAEVIVVKNAPEVPLSYSNDALGG